MFSFVHTCNGTLTILCFNDDLQSSLVDLSSRDTGLNMALKFSLLHTYNEILTIVCFHDAFQTYSRGFIQQGHRAQHASQFQFCAHVLWSMNKFMFQWGLSNLLSWIYPARTQGWTCLSNSVLCRLVMKYYPLYVSMMLFKSSLVDFSGEYIVMP